MRARRLDLCEYSQSFEEAFIMTTSGAEEFFINSFDPRNTFLQFFFSSGCQRQRMGTRVMRVWLTLKISFPKQGFDDIRNHHFVHAQGVCDVLLSYDTLVRRKIIQRSHDGKLHLCHIQRIESLANEPLPVVEGSPEQKTRAFLIAFINGLREFLLFDVSHEFGEPFLQVYASALPCLPRHFCLLNATTMN